MKKAIIFDFDGVLVSSEHVRYTALRKSAAKFDIDIDESLFAQLVGKTTKKFLTDVLTEKQRPHLQDIIDEQWHTYKSKIENYVTPIDVTINFIKDYNGAKIFAVASGSERRIIEKILGHFGIVSKFTLMLCQEDVMHHKPHPEIYLQAINKLGMTADDCVAIEDSIVGVEAARAAGLDCYVMLNGINDKSQFARNDIKGFIRTREDLEKLV